MATKKSRTSAPSRRIARLSWAGLAVAILVAATALFSHWAINAEAFGARDMGLALMLSYLQAFALAGSLYATPAFTLLGMVAYFFDRPSGMRLLVAAVVLSAPFTILLLAERL
jgi:hypothetical protein